MQKKWAETPNFTEAANYVSSGPFMMKEWTHQAEIVLVPNPNWYGTKPTIQELHMKVGGDPTANQASFEAGELDMLAASPPDVPRIKGDAELGPLVTTQPTLIFDYWGFWTQEGSDGQQAPPSRPLDGDRQGHHDGNRLRWPRRRCRQPHPARHAGSSA